jgi:hypothetical protein
MVEWLDFVEGQDGLMLLFLLLTAEILPPPSFSAASNAELKSEGRANH